MYGLDTSTAYIIVTTFADIFMETLKSKYAKPPFYVMKEKLVPSLNTYFLQKHSPYMEKLSESIQRQVQYGLAETKKYHGRGIRGNATESNEETVLKMHHLQSVFYLFLIGLAVAILVFISEIVYSCKNRFYL